MEQLSISENVDTLFHSLENFTQKEGVIGKAVIQGDKTIMPVVSVTVGYGGGNASMGNKSGSQGSSSFGQQSSSGTGALGLGAKLSTEAIIVIDEQSKDVSMIPMNATGASKIAEKIPQIIQGMGKSGQSGQSGQSGSSSQQSGSSSGY